ncbi:hypothetical protein DFR70_111132 [Nocardia tenerifensis]|uniref:Lipocalin-like domain-containing protein n=1 Tax=Nocardia tenerifensis TaxID=228006 RepID=A0A318K7H8_9NOCA|nr:hypothetical protein [Nocardia tenerifensis]PXX59748.1 hypothetical protein DFR70_111132 [Nocardia tenerifensis]
MTKTLLLLLAGLAATAVPAQPASAEPIEFLPVGTWTGLVKVSEDPPHESILKFTASGKVCLTFGHPGEATGTGTGTWQPAGYNRFTFQLTHDVYLPDGTLAAYVAVQHTANQKRDKFSSSGDTQVTDPQGNPVRSGPSSIEATRSSYSTPHCP